MAFVDLEKAFDRVPREVVWWALRYLGVDEWIVSVIRAMNEEATTKVRLNGRESNALSVRDLFSVHYCSSLCWKLCLGSSGKVSRGTRGNTARRGNTAHVDCRSIFHPSMARDIANTSLYLFSTHNTVSGFVSIQITSEQTKNEILHFC